MSLINDYCDRAAQLLEDCEDLLSDLEDENELPYDNVSEIVGNLSNAQIEIYDTYSRLKKLR